ncbi:glycosyltransferase [Mycobacterium sp. SM1]|uniref:glycosyltransferase n=1 Tax=Mycobacterium sp. SM1 TaxID=2816243 RepID=UPI001BCE6956|nr:glycosyltransferase [Mycobacterium sp. SM1]MBS4729538.1 glycosyltransferase [Mycobacterium sp. SM1]
MKFVLASYGTRGDVEPCAAVGRELARRGHDVRLAVPPDLLGFAAAAGLSAVAYGLDTHVMLGAHRNFWRDLFANFWRTRDLIRVWRDAWEPGSRCWGEMSATLASLADGADLLCTGMAYQDVVANVAEYYGIPLATLDHAPLRPNGQLLAPLPPAVGRLTMTVTERLVGRIWRKAEDAQRRELGLPRATGPAPRRVTERGSLEIQAYDEACFPGLATEWAKFDGRRPFVGALTLQLPTDTDAEIASWIAAGSPPIYFGFGSIPVESPAGTLAMIADACAQLGQRALVCAGWSDFSNVPHVGHVKVVDAVNHATVFPACRAVVHHGGAGTTAAGLRAGAPTLILWLLGEQALWGAAIKRLQVGTARRFSSTTRESLLADLRTILAPRCAARAREIATRMSTPADSVAAAADLLEDFARSWRAG